MKSNDRPRKRIESDFLELAETVYRDCTAKCIADIFDLRDLRTLRSRVEKEGISFLTITLPQFARDFERSLADGAVDPKFFRSFRKNGAIPAFLQGMLGQIFNLKTGRIYNEHSEDFPTIIEAVRQICLFFKKVEVPCAPSRVARALSAFVSIERSFDMFSVPEEEYASFANVSSVLWDNLLYGIKPSEFIPSHGPGATAERISGNRKYDWQFWHERLEPFFPLIETAYPLGVAEYTEALENVTLVPVEQEQPVRVVCVPKTLKSPRIIAIEPCCMQYAQQGIRKVLYDLIESYWITTGHINFADQTINQKLAVLASSTGQLATIDLSDASDRVPHRLAMVMFSSNPELRDAIEACRSTRAELPDGSIIGPLKKFASMGSALCFPIEAMYFYTICVMALLKVNNLSVTPEHIFRVSRDVYVYGDDIIVPQTNAIEILDHLRKYNCKVNSDKTFTIGNFRESCGTDAYAGYTVTPVYLGTERPENLPEADRLISWTATANLLYKQGCWLTASLMFKHVERILGPLPWGSEIDSGLVRTSFRGFYTIERWNRDLQRFEKKCWVPEPVYRTDVLDGYGALMKCLLRTHENVDVEAAPDYHMNVGPINPLDSPDIDEHHLERTALHGAVTLKRRWLAAQ